MRYRQIPNTSVSVSEIGFGSGGNAGLMVRGAQSDQQRAVAKALQLGINYFDTAPDYGDGAAEANLGKAFKALRECPFVTSKVEIRRGNLDDIAGHIVRSCESSLQRLRIDCLDCLQIHNGPTHGNPALEGRSYQRLALSDFLRPGGALEGLERLKAAGKINYAGFICRAGDAAPIRELIKTGRFQLINVPYTLVNPSAGFANLTTAAQLDYGGVLKDAKSHGVGCAIFSPLAGGYLSDEYLERAVMHPLARPHDPSSQETRRVLTIAQRVRFLANENGLTLAQAAYRFILDHPCATTVVGGFSSLEQVEEIAQVSGMGPFAPEQITRLEAAWREPL